MTVRKIPTKKFNESVNWDNIFIAVCVILLLISLVSLYLNIGAYFSVGTDVKEVKKEISVFAITADCDEC